MSYNQDVGTKPSLLDYKNYNLQRHKVKGTASLKVLKISLAMIHISEAPCAKPSAKMNPLCGLGPQASASQNWYCTKHKSATRRQNMNGK
jgi:hypothetical protein